MFVFEKFDQIQVQLQSHTFNTMYKKLGITFVQIF